MTGLVLCIPSLNRFDALVKCVQSAQSGTVKPSNVVIMDNSTGKLQLYLEDNNIKLENTLIIRAPINLGCSIAWNYMLKYVYGQLPESYCIVSNDDITFYPDTLEKFQEAIEKNPNEVLFCAGGIASPNAFSLFATRYDLLRDNNLLFDENFRLPYCEDGDLYIRLRQRGYDLFRVDGASADHIGSATIAAFTPEEMELHHMRFQRNAAYFMMKWGIDHNSIHEQWQNVKAWEQIPEELAMSYLKGMFGY